MAALDPSGAHGSLRSVFFRESRHFKSCSRALWKCLKGSGNTRIKTMSHLHLCHVNPIARRLIGSSVIILIWPDGYSKETADNPEVTPGQSQRLLKQDSKLWRWSLLFATSHVRHLNGTTYGHKNISLLDLLMLKIPPKHQIKRTQWTQE